jgi:4-hydroxy-3-polyprenylbenzoate decarboxylase
VISLKNPNKTNVWQALKGADALNPGGGKIIIAVDDDIDPRDLGSVIWALGFRMQPASDVSIAQGKAAALDPSAAPPDEVRRTPARPITSSMLIDATRKWDYPPVALPKKEFMENARKIWEEEGLPPLTPKVPWYGYSLGYWTKEDEEEAELALRGEYYKTGEKQAKNRIKA